MEHNIKTDLVIYKTSNYDQFSFIKENRKVKKNKELERAILEDNKLHLNPIIVSKHLKITDGQHRLTIAKKNKLDIYFIVDNESMIKNIINMNRGGSVWNQKDYLHHFCEMKNYPYQQAMGFMRDYGVGLTQLIKFFVKNKKHRSVTEVIKSGDIEYKYAMSYTENILVTYKKIMEAIHERVSINNFRDVHKEVILKMIMHPGFKEDRFIDNMARSPNPLWLMKDYGLYQPIKDCLCKIYNYREGKDKSWTF